MCCLHQCTSNVLRTFFKLDWQNVTPLHSRRHLWAADRTPYEMTQVGDEFSCSILHMSKFIFEIHCHRKAKCVANLQTLPHSMPSAWCATSEKSFGKTYLCTTRNTRPLESFSAGCWQTTMLPSSVGAKCPRKLGRSKNRFCTRQEARLLCFWRRQRDLDRCFCQWRLFPTVLLHLRASASQRFLEANSSLLCNG